MLREIWVEEGCSDIVINFELCHTCRFAAKCSENRHLSSYQTNKQTNKQLLNEATQTSQQRPQDAFSNPLECTTIYAQRNRETIKYQIVLYSKFCTTYYLHALIAHEEIISCRLKNQK